MGMLYKKMLTIHTSYRKRNVRINERHVGVVFGMPVWCAHI